jgi:lipopolysaccharide/colanic/teichoic acid biosynthesis glycosyltransferase
MGYGMAEYRGKRVFDLAGAALALALVSPLLGLAALGVRLTLGRPVLFRQARMGLGGRPFTLLKLRSMRAGPGEDGTRLTRFGRLLRASAVDELPQLVNVLRGEMSLVGPRPLPCEYRAHFTAAEAARLAVKPGLCGLAQAGGRNAVPWRQRLALDAHYTQQVSLAGDLAIMLRCGGVLLRGEGVSAPGHATMPVLRGFAEEPQAELLPPALLPPDLLPPEGQRRLPANGSEPPCPRTTSSYR